MPSIHPNFAIALNTWTPDELHHAPELELSQITRLPRVRAIHMLVSVVGRQSFALPPPQLGHFTLVASQPSHCVHLGVEHVPARENTEQRLLLRLWKKARRS